MNKKKDSAKVSCHCLRKAPPHHDEEKSLKPYLKLNCVPIFTEIKQFNVFMIQLGVRSKLSHEVVVACI